MIAKQLPYCFLFVLLLLFSCNDASKKKPVVIHKSAISTTTTQKSTLYQSYDQGKNWQASGDNMPLGTQATIIKKIENQLILATDNEGLWISDTNKLKWQRVGESLPSKKVNALHISDGIIYAGLYRRGIYFSSDNGRSWVPINLNLPDLSVGAIWKTDIGLLAGTDSGVFVLKNDASKWELHSTDIQITSFSANEKTIVAGTNKGIMLSTDEGFTWDWVNEQGAVHTIIFLKETIIALFISGDLQFSTDYGQTWMAGNYGPKLGSYGYAAATSTDNTFILSNNYGVHHSNDGGLNWELVYENDENVFFDFLVDRNVLYGVTRQ